MKMAMLMQKIGQRICDSDRKIKQYIFTPEDTHLVIETRVWVLIQRLSVRGIYNRAFHLYQRFQ